MTYSLNTLNNPGGARRVAARRRRPLRPRNRAGPGARGAGVLAARPGELLGAGPGVFHLGHRRRRSATGAAAWAPGWPMPAISCSAFRSGGVSPRPCAPGWRRLRAGCAASANPHEAGCAVLAHAAGLLDRPGGAAVREHGAGMVAPVPLRGAAARSRGRRAGLPGRAAGSEVAGLHRLGPGVRGAGRARRGASCSASPGAMWPSGSARASTASSRRAAKSARSRRTSRSASRPPAQREEVLLGERIEIEEHHPDAGADRAAAGRRAQERARRQGTAEAAVHRAARLASCRRWTCSTARRRGRKRCRPKRWR